MTMAINDVIGELRTQVSCLQSAIESLEQADGGQRTLTKNAGVKTPSRMSAAARKAQSARMTKYWAARRKAASKKSK
jgi:hypothetical protein